MRPVVLPLVAGALAVAVPSALSAQRPSPAIAFTSARSGQSAIWIMAADGGGQHRLTAPGMIAAEAAWSGDGRSVAFAGSKDGYRFHIFTIGMDGRGLRQVTRGPGNDHDPA